MDTFCNMLIPMKLFIGMFLQYIFYLAILSCNTKQLIKINCLFNIYNMIFFSAADQEGHFLMTLDFLVLLQILLPKPLATLDTQQRPQLDSVGLPVMCFDVY